MKWRNKQKLLEAWENFLEVWEWWRSDPKRMLKHCLVVLIAIWALYGFKTWITSIRWGSEGPEWNPSSGAGWALHRYDADGSGSLEPGELEKSPGLNAASSRIDLDNDGALDRREIAARLRLYLEAEAYRIKTVCRVTLDGCPLPEATVRLVPDWFIRSTIEPAVGTTNEQGRAVMAAEGGGDVGVDPGIYSVVISLKDDSEEQRDMLPARYNSQTTLGYEAAPDAGPEGLEPVFELTTSVNAAAPTDGRRPGNGNNRNDE
jgi:hypothetical protein